jgi:hypothetical protein
MAVLYTQHFVQFFDDNGNPLSGGRLYTYDAGGTTPKATYSDAAGSVLNANPVVLDAAGRATVFLDGTTYRFDLKTAGDVLVRSTDNVQSFGVVQSNINNANLAIMPGNTVKVNALATSSTPTDFSIGTNSFLGRAEGNIQNISLNYGKNKIINGKMDVAQRGTSFPALSSSTYCLDRYALQYTTTGVVTVSQQQDAPSDNEFQNSLRVTVTTADTSIASSDFMYLRQSIEGINVRDLIGKSFTLSFRVRSSKTGIHCVAFKNAGFDRAFIAEYTINNENTWETKSITVSPGLITSGTWNWSNGIGLDVEFILMAGSLFQTTTGSWISSSAALCTANQVNLLDTVGNIFAVTGIQLEPGIVATPFEHRPFSQELFFCQRYYETGNVYGYNYSAGAGNHRIAQYPFKANKRTTPSVNVSDILYGGAGANTLVVESVSATMFGARVSNTSSGATSCDFNFQSLSEL